MNDTLLEAENKTEVQQISEMLYWGAWTERDTREGKRMMRTATLSGTAAKQFWNSWRNDRGQWYEAGYSVTKNGQVWQLTQWTDATGQITESAKRKAAEARADELIKHLPADWEPDDVTLTSPQAAMLLDYQIAAAKRLKRALQAMPAPEGFADVGKLTGNALDASDTGCHAKGTPILMFSGRIKPVEEIGTGDRIMGWDGTPREVLSLARGREQMARIIPTKGEPFVVNLSHILSLVQTNSHPSQTGWSKTNGQVVDLTVRDWIAWGATHKHMHKLFRRGVDCWNEKEFRLKPYWLGVLLGDGCLTTKAALCISKPGKSIELTAGEIAAEFGSVVRSDGLPTNPNHHLRNADQLWFELNSYGLAGTNSGNKFVPSEFKSSSRAQRLELLAGLMDTDGSETCGGFDFISKSPTLANDVAFLARSVGLAAYVKPCRKGCQTGVFGDYFRVSISGDCSVVPTRIKIAPERRQKKNVLRTGFKVELLPEDDFYGFSLDGDGRFLLGDFTVTHNTGKTIVALVVCAELGFKPCVIAPLAVLPSWQRWAKTLNVPLGWLINYDKIRTGRSGLGKWKPAADVTKNPHARGEMFVFEYLPGEKPILIFDECHACKSDSTKQGKILRNAATAGHRILCLSATAAKDPSEMRNLGAALGLHTGGREAWQKWCGENGCYSTRYGLKFDPKAAKHLSKLHRQIFPMRGNRIRIADVPSFPETIIQAEALDTGNTETINRAYSDLDDKLAELEISNKTGSQKAAEGLAALMAARIAAEKGKLDLFEELAREGIEEGRSPIIFLNFRAHLENMAKRFESEHIIWGTDMEGRQQKPEERQRFIEDFQHDRARIIFVSFGAGGAGISLHDEFNGQFPRYALLSPSFSCVQLKQALGRAHRAGAKTKSIQRIIFSSGGVEEDICQAMREKLASMETLNDSDMQPGGLAERLKKVRLSGETDKLL